MTIELSEPDLALIIKALETYETANLMTTLTTEMIGAAILCDAPPGLREQMKTESVQRIKDAQKEIERRKAQGLMLRARLTEAKVRASEFSTGS